MSYGFLDFEAFFGGIVVVNAAAAVRDRFHGTEAAKHCTISWPHMELNGRNIFI